MELLTNAIHHALRANTEHGHGFDRDPLPLVKFFSPVGAATWLATELDADGDTLFGLADLGLGMPELGNFSLEELANVRLPFGLGIERGLHFSTTHHLSEWAEAARRTGSIILAEQCFRCTEVVRGDRLSVPKSGRS